MRVNEVYFQGMRNIITLLIALALWSPLSATAQEVAPEPTYEPPTYRYMVGIVEGATSESEDLGGFTSVTVRALLRIDGGPEHGKLVETTSQYDGPTPMVPMKGDRMVVVESTSDGEVQYDLGEPYRLPALGWTLAAFFALVIGFARKKGVMSIIGLGVSIVVLQKIVVGGILAGKEPLGVTTIGMAIILFVSLYLAHGLNKRTTVALSGALVAVVAAYICAQLAVMFTAIAGTGTEEALFLQAGILGHIDLRGLFLSGVLIGAVGVLDDASTAQSAAVAEIAEADPMLSPQELYRRGLIVGREHIASLVNTLVLAYAGASLPLFLLFAIYKDLPVWVTLNSGPIAEEIVRTIIGSGALVLAVPVTTLIAARTFGATSTQKKNPV